MNPAPLLFPSPRQELYKRFENRLEIADSLNRQLVSFQANKREPITRWFKYKEGFASSLIRYFLNNYSKTPGKLLDPFAGAGTALFAAKELGWKAHGIELLPVGAFAILAREALSRIEPEKLADRIKNLKLELPMFQNGRVYFNHIAITKDAFPRETELSLNAYMAYCDSLPDKNLRTFFSYIGFTILEEISYTRKDGQYLRWDHRSNRKLSGKPFDKGRITPFENAILDKLSKIEEDFLFPSGTLPFEEESVIAPLGEIHLVTGSCLEKLPLYEDDSFDFVVTSPPYCNRYDYTRTYALELVYLGCNEEDVRGLRQEMLSCTVENREKIEYLEHIYNLSQRGSDFAKIMQVYGNSEAMTEINIILEKLRDEEQLNNKNIARMVKNYFLEMCFVVSELARVVRPGGYTVMVNDNVRYCGEEIPVDLILSEFAEQFGFHVEKIFILPRGKGNSSQQMGVFGRTETRKCVYLWRKN